MNKSQIAQSQDKLRMIKKYREKLQNAIRIKDMASVQKYSSILKGVLESPSPMGSISVVNPGLDAESPADFGYINEMAQKIQTEIPNMSPDKARAMATSGKSFTDFVLSEAEKRRNNFLMIAENKSFSDAEKMVRRDSGNGDFSNDIQELRRNDEKIFKIVNKLQADFTNHMEDYHGVDSVETQVSDFTLEHNNKSIQFMAHEEADFTNESLEDCWGEPKLYQEFNNDGIIDAGNAKVVINKGFIPRSTRTSFSDIVKGMKPETTVYKQAGKPNQSLVNDIFSKVKKYLIK